jgi:hypothetical protein
MYSSKISCSALHTTGEPIDPVDGMPWALRMAAHRLRRAATAYRSTQQWERDSNRQEEPPANAGKSASRSSPLGDDALLEVADIYLADAPLVFRRTFLQ